MPIPAHKASPPAHDAAQIHQFGPAVMSKARSQPWRQNGGSACVLPEPCLLLSVMLPVVEPLCNTPGPGELAADPGDHGVTPLSQERPDLAASCHPVTLSGPSPDRSHRPVGDIVSVGALR